MILDAIFGAVMAAATWLVELLPDGDPIGLTSVSGIWLGYSQLNTFLPLTELMQAVGVMLGMQAALYGYLALRQVRQWLPFV